MLRLTIVTLHMVNVLKGMVEARKNASVHSNLCIAVKMLMPCLLGTRQRCAFYVFSGIRFLGIIKPLFDVRDRCIYQIAYRLHMNYLFILFPNLGVFILLFHFSITPYFSLYNQEQ